MRDGPHTRSVHYAGQATSGILCWGDSFEVIGSDTWRVAAQVIQVQSWFGI